MILINLFYQLSILKMFKFQKILVVIYILAQVSLQYYLLKQLCFEKQFQNEDPLGSVDQLVPHFVMALITSVLFLSVHFKNPGFIVISDKDMIKVNQDRQGNSQIKNEVDKQKVANENKIINADEVINTERSIFENNPNNNLKNPLKSFKVNNNIKAQNNNMFCHICQIYQPYRTKHCHQCDNCVSTYDHHCPWMNTCIGEKNRPLFYVFLIAQICQTFSVAVRVASIAINSLYLDNKYIASILSIALILFLGLLLVLLLFHSYLMLSNLTTWQFLKGQNIPYMRTIMKSENNEKCELEKKECISQGQIASKAENNSKICMQSPFSMGALRNIWQYWSLGFIKDRKVWQFDINN